MLFSESNWCIPRPVLGAYALDTPGLTMKGITVTKAISPVTKRTLVMVERGILQELRACSHCANLVWTLFPILNLSTDRGFGAHVQYLRFEELGLQLSRGSTNLYHDLFPGIDPDII